MESSLSNSWSRQMTAKERQTVMLPILISALYYVYLFSILFVQEADAADFNDLGKMLLGGFALAIAIAVLFVFVKLRLRDKRPQTAKFLSISHFAKRK